MCLRNSAENICGYPLSTYTSTLDANKKPQVIFCDMIRAHILQALLQCPTPSPNESLSIVDSANRPPYDQVVNKSDARFKALAATCNLWHGGKEYQRIVFPPFKGLVKYLCRQTAMHGVFKRVGGRWERNKDVVFGSIGELVDWLREKSKEGEKKGVKMPETAKTPQSKRISASQYASPDALASSMAQMNLQRKSMSHSLTQRTLRRSLWAEETLATPPTPQTPTRRRLFAVDETPVPRSVQQWARDVPAKADLQDQLDRLGQEYEDRLLDLKKISERRAKIWAQI